MLRNLFKFLSFTTLILTGQRSSAFASSDSEEEMGSGLAVDEIAGGMTEYDLAVSGAGGDSRELLNAPPTSSLSPTYAPNTLFPYMVNNSASVGAYSLSAALNYVNNIGGVHNLTFGSGAYNQTCKLTSDIDIDNPISFDLARMSPKGFTLEGSDSYYITTSTSPIALTFTSSSGSGSFSFSGSGFVGTNGHHGHMSTTVSTGVILSLLRGSYFSGGSAYDRTTTIVNTGATLALSESSYFSSSGLGSITINNDGVLSIDTAAEFQGFDVTIAAGATFVSGTGGAFFGGSTLSLATNATHLATIGAGSQPVQMITWSSSVSTATLAGATLNIMSDQNLYSLLGYNYTIMAAASGSSISGQYGLLQFSGSSVNLPYKVYYTPSPTVIKNIIVGFPIPPSTIAPSRQPSASPSKEPSASPSKLPSKVPSYEPSSIPSKEPSTEPSKIPTKVPSSAPSKLPTSTPSIEPSSATPSNEPSNSPSKMPSNQPSGEPTAKPSVQPSKEPSASPSKLPTSKPTIEPSTTAPTNKPSNVPSKEPSNSPSAFPSKVPSTIPSSVPSLMPTNEPSKLPSLEPSTAPSIAPSKTPSVQPTNKPSLLPTHEPSKVPTNILSKAPSFAPSSEQPSLAPSLTPSKLPTGEPSLEPSKQPSIAPSKTPSVQPTNKPSLLPTQEPSKIPTNIPSKAPSFLPSKLPSIEPSVAPSKTPSGLPTSVPSLSPSLEPTTLPSHFPTTDNQECTSSLYSKCIILKVSNCSFIGYILSTNSSSRADIGDLFSGTSLMECIITHNCTIVPGFNATAFFNSSASSTSAARAVHNYYNTSAASTSNSDSGSSSATQAYEFIPTVYKLQPKSSTNCNVTHVSVAPTPQNFPVNTTYIVESKGTLLCFSVFESTSLYRDCSYNPHSNSSVSNSSRRLLEAEMEEAMEAKEEPKPKEEAIFQKESALEELTENVGVSTASTTSAQEIQIKTLTLEQDSRAPLESTENYTPPELLGTNMTEAQDAV